jgi:hypothetical protein
MGRLGVFASTGAVAVVVAGCAGPLRLPDTGPTEGLPGPAWYTLTILPDSAIEERDIVLTPYQGVETRPADLVGPTDLDASDGADLYRIGGHRVVYQITLPWTLEATVDGRPCDGIVELPEGLESDATLTIEGDRCELRLDGRHDPELAPHPGLETAPTA